MNITSILQTAILVSIVVLVASCSTNRHYREYPPSYPNRTRTSFSLIINPYPGFMMSRYPDGRYYYRSPEGYMYWRGYDNRFYLDRSYLGRVTYDRRQYNDWNRYYGKNYHRKNRRYR
jgi:hypothetical protein